MLWSKGGPKKSHFFPLHTGTIRKFSDPKSADWKCRPYVLKSTFLVLPSTKRNWLFEAVHAICKPFQSKNVDIACWITFYLQKTFSLVMKTELLLSINAKATSNRLGTPHRAAASSLCYAQGNRVDCNNTEMQLSNGYHGRVPTYHGYWKTMIRKNFPGGLGHKGHFCGLS